MKRKYFLLVVLFSALISVKVNAQINVIGRHQINTWIESTQDYTLTGWAKNLPPKGIFVEFNEDGSFVTYESKWSNDCYKNTKGFYTWKDENHISIYLTEVRVGGMTCDEQSNFPNKDLGLFFIDRNWYSGGLRLIPSGDSLKVD